MIQVSTLKHDINVQYLYDKKVIKKRIFCEMILRILG